MKNTYISNYLALFACIVSERELAIDEAIKKITLQDLKRYYPVTDKVKLHRKKLGKSKIMKTIVVDAFTNEKYEFESGSEAEKFVGANRGIVAGYIKTGRIYKKRYIFKRAN